MSRKLPWLVFPFILLVTACGGGGGGGGISIDLTPDPFSFAALEGGAPGLMYESAPVTLRGFDGRLELRVAGGSYSLNGAAFTQTAGTAAAGDRVILRGTASNQLGATRGVHLDVGGVSATFDVTTGTSTLAMQAMPGALTFGWTAFTGVTHYRLLENPDGASGFVVAADAIAGDAETFRLPVSVHLLDWNNAVYQLEACNAAGCATVTGHQASLEQPQSVAAVHYLKSNATQANAFFGRSVALSADGRILAVGETAAPNGGAVSVYQRDASGHWQFDARLQGDNTEHGDQFGENVALSADGSRLAVAAHGESSNGVGGPANNDAAGSGALYVFERQAGAWEEIAYLKAPNADADDLLGVSLAISADGDVVAAGAFGENGDGVDPADNSVGNSGAVYVFVRDAVAGNWTAHYLKASNPDIADSFGQSVALAADGNTLAAGATLEAGDGINGPANNGAPGSGAVYVFQRDPVTGTWMESAYLKASNVGVGDTFGHSVALSSDGALLLVGAPEEASDGTDPADDSVNESGAVYVFAYDSAGDAWMEQAMLKALSPLADGSFGHALALSGNGEWLAVGEVGNAGDSRGVGGDALDTSGTVAGAVHLLHLAGDSFVHERLVKATNPEANDSFASAVTISGNGEALAVGARFEASDSTGINGNQDSNVAPFSGAAYVY